MNDCHWQAVRLSLLENVIDQNCANRQSGEIIPRELEVGLQAEFTLERGQHLTVI